MKKLLAIFLGFALIISLSSAFALNWTNAEVAKCTEYVLIADKYIEVDSDIGVAYEKSAAVTAKTGDIVYFAINAMDTQGELVDAEIEYHNLGNVEAMGELFKAQVIGPKPYVKISIVEKTPIEELSYNGKEVYVDDDTVIIGDLILYRNEKGTVLDVGHFANGQQMIKDLAEIGITIDDVFAGKVCMSDDILVANFGKICKTEAVAKWYVETEDSFSMGIPKTGDPVSIIAPSLVMAASLYMIFRKK